MVRRKRDVAIIVLRCVIIGCCAGAQQAAFGTEMATPPKSASGSYIVAQADTPFDPQAMAQETKNTDAPAEPQAVMREIKSASRLSSSKQRRRKPKIAGVPAGLQVAQEAKEPEPQAVAKETKAPGSQTATQGPEETDTLNKPLAGVQETKNADASAKPQAEAGAKGYKAGGAGKKRYGMAPIRWASRLSEEVGLKRQSQTSHGSAGSNIASGSTSSSDLIHTQTAEIRAATYIMQPYIAKVNGNIGVVSSRNTTSTMMSNTSTANSGRNNKLFGDGVLSLFSQSRFPFTMSLGVADDRTNAESQTQDMVNKYLNLDQSYSALGSTSTYNVGYGRATQTSSGVSSGSNSGGTDTKSFWRGHYSNTTTEHRTNATVRYNDKIVGSVDNRVARTDSFMVTDSYLPEDSLLSLQSFVAVDSSTDNSTAYNSRMRNLQANTDARWQPESEDIPLFVDGNVRLFRMSTINRNTATLLQSLGGNVNARYLFSRNLTGYANGNVTITNSNGTRNLTTIQSGNAYYSSDAVILWKNSSYSWNANGGASNQTGAGSDKSVFGSVGHGLRVPYAFSMFGKKLQLNSSINQSLNTNIDQRDGQSITLVNGGSISLGSLLASAPPNKELLGGFGAAEGMMNTTATLSVNDSRKIGGKTPSQKHNYALTLRLQETSKSNYSRYGVDVEATLGAVQGTGGGRMTLIGSSTAKYRKSRVFDVRGLDYAGILKIDGESRSGEAGVSAQSPRFPWSLDQRLIYRIGQNEVLLRGTISDRLGVKNASLWLLFKAWRIVGN